jgi:hypothetical protein
MNMAEMLNLACLCQTLQPQLLAPGLRSEIGTTHPHLFSATPVFITDAELQQLADAVAALHRVAMLPGWREAALRRRPGAAHVGSGPRGAFMGYDFHMADDGPRLIEINTNAGGAFLHAAAARAHRACCTPMDRMFAWPADLERLDATFVQMFLSEWRLQRGEAPLRNVAIVDDAPMQQYLAPEFELARLLFERHGIAAVIADARELQWRGGRLWHHALPAGQPVDLVYNRLTDFDLAAPAHAALHDAYVQGAAVVTPHPHAHAVHADKRNLIALSDDAQLAAWGASEADRATLRAVVPLTQAVSAENAEALWTQRRRLFFKPATGYGSKAAYRGDKLTRRVWDEIVTGGFVAQALVPPSERLVDVGGEPVRLKLDVRAYAYDGRTLLLAARTYAGQTTNFRTPGGGFSPVVVLPSLETAEPCNC